MNRRLFLSTLGAFAATAVLDPELLLWKPGAKRIFIPKPQREFAEVVDVIEVRPEVFFKNYAVSVHFSMEQITEWRNGRWKITQWEPA